MRHRVCLFCHYYLLVCLYCTRWLLCHYEHHCNVHASWELGQNKKKGKLMRNTTVDNVCVSGMYVCMSRSEKSCREFESSFFYGFRCCQNFIMVKHTWLTCMSSSNGWCLANVQTNIAILKKKEEILFGFHCNRCCNNNNQLLVQWVVAWSTCLLDDDDDDDNMMMVCCLDTILY